jgi:hypothetical protein
LSTPPDLGAISRARLVRFMVRFTCSEGCARRARGAGMQGPPDASVVKEALPGWLTEGGDASPESVTAAAVAGVDASFIVPATPATAWST